MKIAILTDTHIGVRQDSPRFDESLQGFFENMFFPTLRQRKIDTIIHCGDVFDNRRRVNVQILANAKKYFVDNLGDMSIHVIVGNHDAYYTNVNTMNTPEMVLKDLIPSCHVYDSAVDVSIGGRQMLFVPWITSENKDRTLKTIAASNSEFVFGHLQLIGHQMYRGVEADHGTDGSVFSKFRKVFTGHFHHRSEKGNVLYLGSPTQHIWQDCGDQRGFHIFDTETGEMEFIINPVSMFEMVKLSGLPKDNFQQFSRKYIKLISEEGDRERVEAVIKALEAAGAYEVVQRNVEKIAIQSESNTTLHDLQQFPEWIARNVEDKQVSSILLRLLQEASA